MVGHRKPFSVHAIAVELNVEADLLASTTWSSPEEFQDLRTADLKVHQPPQWIPRNADLDSA